MNKKTIIMPALAALMLFLVISLASACSCIYLENTQAKLDNAAYIFSGEVIDIQTSEAYANQEMQEATIRVINHWKPSSFPESVNLKVYANRDSDANCGYNFEEGKEYLIYAYLDSETNKISTNSCMGSLELDKAQQEIKYLNGLTNSTNPNPIPNQNEEENVFSKFFSWIRNLFS